MMRLGNELRDPYTMDSIPKEEQKKTSGNQKRKKYHKIF
jgi:hypothetical protein